MSFFQKILVCFLIIALVLTPTGCTHKDTESTSSDEGFFWDQDESELVDVKIVDDEVYLYYSLCFYNGYDYSMQVLYPNGDFSWFDCLGWLKYEKSFRGKTVDGGDSVLIPPKTKMSEIFVFQGEYLGGKIKEDIRLSTLVFATELTWKESN